MLIIVKGKRKLKRNSATYGEWLDKYAEHKERKTEETNKAWRDAEASLTPGDFVRANERKIADIHDEETKKRKMPKGVEVKKPWKPKGE